MGKVDITSTAVEKAIDAAKDFLQKLVGPSIEEMGLLLSDNVKVWRFKNQIRNINKVKAIVDKQKVNVKRPEMKVLVSYLEGVSLEEDETLQDMWANLFTNYIDTDIILTLTVYPSILKQLSTTEVAILKHMDEYRKLHYRNDWHIIKSDGAIGNLERLGLIRNELKLSTYNQHTNDDGHSDLDIEEIGSDYYYLTSFGSDFVNACKR